MEECAAVVEKAAKAVKILKIAWYAVREHKLEVALVSPFSYKIIYYDDLILIIDDNKKEFFPKE